jgi:hypothetical protein
VLKNWTINLIEAIEVARSICHLREGLPDSILQLRGNPNLLSEILPSAHRCAHFMDDGFRLLDVDGRCQCEQVSLRDVLSLAIDAEGMLAHPSVVGAVGVRDNERDFIGYKGVALRERNANASKKRGQNKGGAAPFLCAMKIMQEAL